MAIAAYSGSQEPVEVMRLAFEDRLKAHEEAHSGSELHQTARSILFVPERKKGC